MKTITVGAVILSAASVLWAQAERPEGTAGVGVLPGAQQAESSSQTEQLPPQREEIGTPVPSSGVGVPTDITLRTQSQQSDYSPSANSITGGLEFATTYDDNLLNTSGGLRGFQFEIAPDVAIYRTGSRSKINLNYRTGVRLNQSSAIGNEAVHDLSATLMYRLSRHVEMNLRQSFSHQSSPFARSLGDPRAPTSSNEFVVTPSATRNYVVFGGDLEWQFAPHSVIGASSEYSLLRFSSTGDQLLLPHNETNFKAYFGQQLSAKHSVGAAGTFQFLKSPGQANATTRALGVQLFDTYQFNNRLALSLYGGPQSARTRFNDASADSRSQVFFTGGATLGLQNSRRLHIALSFEDGISGGGGITQVVKLRSGLAGVTVRVSRNWDLGVTCGVGDNEVLTAEPGPDHFTTVYGTILLSRQLTSSVRLETRYESVHQTTGTAGQVLPNIERNRFTVSVAYRFNRPMRSLAQ